MIPPDFLIGAAALLHASSTRGPAEDFFGIAKFKCPVCDDEASPYRDEAVCSQCAEHHRLMHRMNRHMAVAQQRIEDLEFKNRSLQDDVDRYAAIDAARSAVLECSMRMASAALLFGLLCCAFSLLLFH